MLFSACNFLLLVDVITNGYSLLPFGYLLGHTAAVYGSRLIIWILNAIAVETMSTNTNGYPVAFNGYLVNKLLI